MFKVDSAKLEAVRSKKGKSQGDVAKKIGITQGAYSVREKAANFTDDEIDIICKFLGIKKEQIELKEDALSVAALSYLTNKAIQTESALTVILGALAEILAIQSGGSVTKIRTDLQSAVDSLSKQEMDKLEHPV